MSQGKTTVIDLDDAPAAGAAASEPVVIEDDGAAAVVVDEDGELGGDLPTGATRNADGSVTLKLTRPVSVTVRSARNGERQETYAELTFRDLTGADVRAIQAASPASQPIVMLARSTGIREAVMNRLFDLMRAADIAAAQECVASFFPAGAKSKST